MPPSLSRVDRHIPDALCTSRKRCAWNTTWTSKEIVASLFYECQLFGTKRRIAATRQLDRNQTEADIDSRVARIVWDADPIRSLDGCQAVWPSSKIGCFFGLPVRYPDSSVG